jgi:hypothetical protein
MFTQSTYNHHASLHNYNYHLHLWWTSQRVSRFNHIGKFNIITLMPHSHLTLAKTQSISLKPGKAPLVIAEASGYSNAPTRTCSGYFQVCLS